MAVAIDTHAAVQALEEAGMEQKQAEVIVQIIGKQSDGPPTKADLRAGFAELQTSLLKTMIGTQVATAGLIITAIKLF